MTCESCGDKPKKCNKDFTKAVIEIDNPEQITLMRKVVIPASMGDDTTVPPTVGKYHNVLLYYEANSKSYLYSSDGIPTQLVNGVTDYEAAVNLPQINGSILIGDKTGEELGLQDKLTAGDNITIENNVISATDTTYGPATSAQIGLVKPGEGLEVAADGTMSISGIEQYAHFFDTVADMKAADLIDGDYARTLGYYAVNDNGSALYKVSVSQPSSYYETLNSGLYAELIPENVIANVKQFGLAGDGTVDDTAKMSTALSYAVSNGLTLRLNEGDTYLLTNTITVNYPNNNIMIDGQFGNIKMNPTNRTRFLELTAKNIDIQNINFNGDGSPQDQFDETSWNNLRISTPISATAENINLNNVSMRNWYGSGPRFYNYHNVNIENIILENVGGHWYQNNAYDAFGDAFSFVGHSDEANINISNVIANGKYKGSTLSRVGLAFDFAANKTDTVTNVNINNCDLINYDRGIHVESILGKMNIVYNNGRCVNNVFLFSYGNDNTQVYFSGDNLILDYHNGTYNGSKGIYNSIFNISNSIIDCNYGTALGMFHAGGEYNKCTLNNLHSSSFNTGDKIVFKECTVNLSTLTQYLCYGTDVHWMKCIFNSSTYQAEARSARSMKYSSCTMNNFMPFYVGEDLFNVFYLTDTTLDLSQMYYIQSGTVYIDNVMVSSPNISRTFPVSDISLYNYFGTRSVPNSGTIPLIPSFDNTFLRPNSKYILITLGHNSAIGAVRNGKNFDNYYYNVVTTNSSSEASIGTTQVIGNPSAGGFNLDISNTNNTIAHAGSYATYVGQWLLPYYYKDYLKNQ